MWAIPASFALMFGLPSHRIFQSFFVIHLVTLAIALPEEKEDWRESEGDSINRPAQYNVLFVGVPKEEIDQNVR